MLRRCSFATLVLNCETACVLFTSSQFCGQCIVERVVPRGTAATHMTQRIHRLQTESQRYPVAQPISREPPATLVHTKWESTWPLEMGNSCPNFGWENQRDSNKKSSEMIRNQPMKTPKNPHGVSTCAGDRPRRFATLTTAWEDVEITLEGWEDEISLRLSLAIVA